MEIQILNLKYKITEMKKGIEEIGNALRYMFSYSIIHSSDRLIDIITNKALENGIKLKKTLNFRFDTVLAYAFSYIFLISIKLVLLVAT